MQCIKCTIIIQTNKEADFCFTKWHQLCVIIDEVFFPLRHNIVVGLCFLGVGVIYKVIEPTFPVLNISSAKK